MRNVEIPSDHFEVRDMECRNTSSQKCRNAEMRNDEILSDHFGVRDLECRNTSSQKCQNVKMHFRIRLWSEPVVTSVEDGGRS
jgi:hypothetical protein